MDYGNTNVPSMHQSDKIINWMITVAERKKKKKEKTLFVSRRTGQGNLTTREGLKTGSGTLKAQRRNDHIMKCQTCRNRGQCATENSWLIKLAWKNFERHRNQPAALTHHWEPLCEGVRTAALWSHNSSPTIRDSTCSRSSHSPHVINVPEF